MSRTILILTPIFLIFAVTFSFLSLAQQKTIALFDKLLFTQGNDTLPYRLLKPADPQPEKSYPLIIFLHGAGERGNDNEVQVRHITAIFSDPDNRSSYPCYVLAPQCHENMMWAKHDRDAANELIMRPKPTRPMALLIQLIDKLEKEFSIDLSRIYVVGLSMGGFGTWELLARFPDRFAAAVPICGGGDISTAKEIRHIPIWAFHGAQDKVVPPQRSRVMVKAMQDAGGAPGYTEYPHVGHDSWVYAFRESLLMPWLFDQKLKNQTK